MNTTLQVTRAFFKKIFLANLSIIISVLICHAQKIEECEGARINKQGYCVSDRVINKLALVSYDFSMNFYAINYTVGMSFTFDEFGVSTPKILRLNRATKVNFLFEDSSKLSFQFRQIPNVYPDPNLPQSLQEFPEDYLAMSSHHRSFYKMEGSQLKKKQDYYTYDNYIEIRPTELMKFATSKLIRVDFLPLSEYQSKKSMFQPFHYEVTVMDQTEIMKIVSCFYSLAAKVNNK